MGEHASPEELAAYALDSSLLAAARREHIATCPICQPESAWLHDVVTGLAEAPQCPDVETLVAFALGRASADEQIAVAAHLRTCDSCTDEVELTRATLQTSEQKEGVVVGAIRRIVATLVPSPLAPSVRGAPDQRGADATAAGGIYAVGAMKLTLSVERDDDTLVLSGVLEGAPVPVSKSGQTPPERVALLYRQETVDASGAPPLVDSKQLTPNNAFTFYDVPRGAFQLELTQGDLVIAVESIVIAEE
jgi:hypothetical protein